MKKKKSKVYPIQVIDVLNYTSYIREFKREYKDKNNKNI